MPPAPGERTLALTIPQDVLDQIVEEAAQIVIAQLGHPEPDNSPYMTIVQAAEYMQAKRHRVDDLLSKGVLTRIKDGSRTLVARAELEAYLAGKPTGRRAR
jgi:excisionase family DNA binding protein